MTKASDNVFPRLLISEGGSTATPAADLVTIYAKANGLLYSKDDAGTETALGGGGAGDVAADAIWDAAGDLAVGTGADTAARLAIGTADRMVLQRASGAVAWGYAPFIGAKAYNTTTQTIGDASATAVTFNSEATEGYDTHAFHDTGSNTSRFTVPTGLDGYYSLKMKILFVGNATGERTIWFHKGGTVIRGSGVTVNPTSTAQVQMVTTVDVYLAATNYVEAIVYQASGGNLNIGHASQADWQSTMSIAFLGA